MRNVRVAATLVIGLAWPAAVWPQTPQLVKDINQTADPQPGTDPTELTAHLGALFYVGDDSANSRDIRRMDGTGAVSFLLDTRDFDGPSELTPGGGALFFAADHALYRTDGTPAGTSVVHSFGTNDLHSLTYVNGLVFFVRSLGGPTELWRSDGTDAGTIALPAADPELLTAAGNRLFFVRYNFAIDQGELWTSDGTVPGTHKVVDTCPSPCGSPDELEAVGGIVYFAGADAVHGTELWRSDGTTAGTFMVRDVIPGSDGQEPRGFAAFGSSVLYTGAGSTGYGLWISDGTSPGTRELRPRLNLDFEIHDAGGRAFFGAIDDTGPTSEPGLWTTDGTAAGTRLVSPVCPGGCSTFSSFGTLSGVTVFSSYWTDNDLWRTDGTTAGTFRISANGGSGGCERFGNALYYASGDADNGGELWRTDGTSAGTVRVTNRTESSSFPQPLANVDTRMFFGATQPDIGRELWTTTGPPASTSVLELTPGPDSSYFETAIALDGRLVFGKYSSEPSLWASDGTPAGTLVIRPNFSAFGPYARVGDAAVFAGGLGGGQFGDVEPWKTDGTVPGTSRVADVRPGPYSSSPSWVVPFRDQAAFVATTDLAFSLWITDGTADGTRMITSRSCHDLAPVDDKLFMACSDDATGEDVWVSDGTETGTRLVRDITTAFVRELVAVEGRLYFLDDGGNVWLSDGTQAGTQMLSDVVGFPTGATARFLTAAGGVLFYTAYTPATGYELWRTDGTPSGTGLLRDVVPGPDSGVLGDTLAAAGSRVVFTGYTPASGWEPWQSDGTVAGTTPLGQIAPGPASSLPSSFRYGAGRVYFSASDNTTGFEPWTVQLPAAVSVGDAVMREGDAGSTDAVFQVRLEPAATGVVTVGYATVAGTAQAGSDFSPRSGTLTFQPGQTSLPVAVPVLGDLQDEGDETFTLELSGAAAFADRRGVGLVLDDDGPTATIAPASVAEGNAGSTDAMFTVTLTTRDGAPTPAVKTVGFATTGVTATAGTDYLSTTGTLTFAAGTASGGTLTIPVAVLGDTIDEPDETFQVRLNATSDATVPPSPAIGTIRDDDGIASAPPVELGHGSFVRATLQPPLGRLSDRDWYVVRQQPSASYELVVDETSGDAVPIEVERVGPNGAVVQSGVATGTGASVSLRWENTSSVVVSDQSVRVGSAACGTACGADDGYRVRFYETTLSGSRFNNTGSQTTVVLLQNPTSVAVNADLQLWASNGLAFLPQHYVVPPRGVLVVNTAVTLGPASGSVTVIHDAPYGALAGKVVALEPSTGFSFDTPLEYRPR